MLFEKIKPYAQELVGLVPDQFLFYENEDWWFLRDGTWHVMDLRSSNGDTIGVFARQNI